MKTTDATLISFLFGAHAYVFADLYTIQLSNGDLFYYTGADQPVVLGGHTYLAAPCLTDNGLSQRLGIQTDTFEIIVNADGRTLMEGLPLLTFIKLNGLDQSVITAQRAYWTEWGGTYKGVITRFKGRYSEAKDAGQTQVTVVVASYMELFTTAMPTDIFGAQCLNTLFDTKCTLLASAHEGSGTITGTSTQRALVTSITATTGTYNLGTLIFTTGANVGLRRSITGQDSSGNILLVAPLTVAPSNGDAFHIYPGCDLLHSTCDTKFSNTINFRGQDLIPAPEVAV